MGGINDILNTGRSALLSQQAAISVTARNTANANTVGYHKRDVILTSQVNPRGLVASDARRDTDAYLARKMLTAEGGVGSASAKRPSLTAMEQLFADREGGLGDTLDAFFNALRNLEVSPMNLDLRRNVLTTGETVAQTVSAVAESLTLERRQADQVVDGIVARVNDLTADIASINKQTSNTPAAAEELLDRREVLATELARYVDVSTFVRGDGQMVVLFAGGSVLVDRDRAAQLTSTPDATYGDMRRVDFVGRNGTITDVTSKISTGQLGGAIALRDATITSFIDRLDQFAFDLATEFNTVHRAGFGTDASSGRNFFDPPAGVAQAASTFALVAGLSGNPDQIAAASSAVNAIGGNGNLLALQALEDQRLAASGVRSFVEELADMLGEIGRSVQSNEQAYETASIESEQLILLNASATGVSIDEEMIDLTRYQRGYQAGARLIHTVNTMFDAIMQL
ncbi:MAG: flagellar hook-associated protein FlgK [Nannocystaceae bacterium]